MDKEPASIQTHISFKYRDAEDETLYSYTVYSHTGVLEQRRTTKDRYEFQMLLEVDEELRDMLIGARHKLRVYVPFGEDWYEYSIKRLKENPKLADYVAKDVTGSLTSAIKG